MSAPVEVTIDYYLRGGELRRLSLLPSAYFDLDEGEVPEIDSVPKHDNACDYISPRVDVRVTRLCVSSGSNMRVIVSTFSRDGQSRITERTDTGEAPYWELILEFKLPDGSWQVTRIDRDAGILRCVYEGLIVDNLDGSQSETKIDW